jgi:hypothetical protein
MATPATNPALHTFVIWAPDYTDDEAFSRRLAVRPQHLARAAENKAKGYLTVRYFSLHRHLSTHLMD